MEGSGRGRGWRGGVGEGRGLTRCLFIILLAKLTVALTEVIIPMIDHLDV